MSDIARLAGVSPMTVSRVVNGDARVRAATREKVEAVIRETGYVPDPAARILARLYRDGAQAVDGFTLDLVQVPGDPRARASLVFGHCLRRRRSCWRPPEWSAVGSYRRRTDLCSQLAFCLVRVLGRRPLGAHGRCRRAAGVARCTVFLSITEVFGCVVFLPVS